MGVEIKRAAHLNSLGRLFVNKKVAGFDVWKICS